MTDQHEIDAVATDLLSSLEIGNESSNEVDTLICDVGYGFPKEKKPRREKVNAVTRQIVNFLEWQVEASENDPNKPLALVKVVGCHDNHTRSVLEDRTKALLKTDKLPSHVVFTCNSLEDVCSPENNTTTKYIYLSPDAEEAVDPAKRPPSTVIIGMLIDRRVQPNRSRDRALGLDFTPQRWALGECFAEINPKEPLNVDCILEGMQQWWWNCESGVSKESFIQAASQAIEHHAKRHPSRPIHLPAQSEKCH
ncbi:unnamed protein product [Cylindrotheca closterium]|uniref:SAM-dependent MTase TRM10-type domain-containing protein n=1 Tax=Cylindrotheca closterium TaxID=2856 RepID=A0AAD2FTR8_9STRA|nr:unnamed protein product [Cylindrotheca closterium]